MKGYSKFQIVLRYLQFWLKAKSKNLIHSPYIFSLLQYILGRQNEFRATWSQLELRRKSLHKDQKTLEFKDPGNGQTKKSTVAAIAKRTSKQARLCQILFLLARKSKSRRILELGTSLGVSSSYIFSGMLEGGQMISIEGIPELAQRAQSDLNELGLHIGVREGLFQDQLPSALQDLGKVDLAFIDGHHQYAPTLKYLEQILPYCHEDTVLVFDDIHWSPDMEKAWSEIKQHQDVSQTVDLFFLGLVFPFRKAAKEHFAIRL